MASGTAAVAAPVPADAHRMTETAQQVQLKVVNGKVEIHVLSDESRRVEVYALTGQVVKTMEAQPGVNVIDLPAGYYIVKCDRLSQRVIVR